MKLLRGPISRLVVVAITSMALLAMAVVITSVVSARQNLALLAEAQKRSELALLSARIRSECLVLTDMVEAYVFEAPGKSTAREAITAQSQKLDGLIKQAIGMINPGDVDESLEIGTIRQGLIAFSTQADRVLEAFDASRTIDERTTRELRFLIESYQAPLVESLERFENFETQRADEALDEAKRLANLVSNIMLGAAIFALVTAALVIRQTALRFMLPLGRLRDGVEQMRSRNLEWRIDIDHKDEMGDLARAINQMAGDLHSSQEKLQEYASTLEELVKARTAELRKLTIAVEQSPSSVVITSTAGVIEYVNPRFTNLTGYQPDEVLGRKSSMLQSGLTPRETYTDLWQTITASKIWKGEFINRKKNGDLYWEEAIISPVRDDDGNMTHFIAIKEDISHRKQAEIELRRLASIDPLTEAFNRRQFFLMAEYMLAESRRYDTPLSALMFDVDHFKQVNDTYGHPMGDEVLRQVVVLVREQIRDVDILGRYGGEEFVLLMPHTLPDEALQAAERIRLRVAAHTFDAEQGPFKITISIGVSRWHTTETGSVEMLIQKADQALYRAKQTGRNRVVLYDPSLTKPNQKTEGPPHD